MRTPARPTGTLRPAATSAPPCSPSPAALAPALSSHGHPFGPQPLLSTSRSPPLVLPPLRTPTCPTGTCPTGTHFGPASHFNSSTSHESSSQVASKTSSRSCLEPSCLEVASSQVVWRAYPCDVRAGPRAPVSSIYTAYFYVQLVLKISCDPLSKKPGCNKIRV